MMLFWSIGALVAAAALVLVLRPLIAVPRRGASRSDLNVSVYRDQLRELEADLGAGTLAREDYERSRAEIERRLLADVGAEGRLDPVARAWNPRAALVVAVAVPALALGVYLLVGNPDALDPRLRQSQVGMPEIEKMVQRLADRLEQNPEDLEGWKMLGKSYTVIGRFGEASKAYAQAARRAPRDPQVLADLADAIAMSRGQSMKGEPEELVLRALQLDPKNLKALALAGTAAYDRQDFVGAAKFWERMLPLVPAGSEEATAIAQNVEEARTLARHKPAASQGGLKGTVTLSPELAARVSPTDTLFIFARAAEGPPMPLAVQRRKAGDLPVAFALDDSMAMAGRKLSAVPRVIVGARISRSGNATPQPGDLQGLSGIVANTTEGVRLVIDTEGELALDVDVHHPTIAAKKEFSEYRRQIEILRGLLAENKNNQEAFQNLLAYQAKCAEIALTAVAGEKPVLVAPEEKKEQKAADIKDWEGVKVMPAPKPQMDLEGITWVLVDEIEILNKESEDKHIFTIKEAKDS